MRDIAVLAHAALKMGSRSSYGSKMQPSTATSSYALEELWKSNLIVSARAGDIAAGRTSFLPGQIVSVSEKRLGFGSFASSNLAQRFSNALTGWTLEKFDKLEA